MNVSDLYRVERGANSFQSGNLIKSNKQVHVPKIPGMVGCGCVTSTTDYTVLHKAIGPLLDSRPNMSLFGRFWLRHVSTCCSPP